MFLNKNFFTTLCLFALLITSKAQSQGVANQSSISNGIYSVHSSCELPATSYSRTIYVDANLGTDALNSGGASVPFKSLSYPLANKLIKPGDHVIVQPGSYNLLSLTSTNLPNSSQWTWFDLKPTAIVAGLKMSQITRVLVTGGSLTKPTGIVVQTQQSNQTVVANSLIYSSSKATNTLTVAEWLSLADAVGVREGFCNSVIKNQIRNVRSGIGMSTAKQLYPNNSMKGLVELNDIRGFSGDGLRGIGSDLIFKGNTVVDGYVSAADGDGNHDDMFQGFALNGRIFENLIIENNFMLDRSSSQRNLINNYQGICIFDGLYRNVIIRNNAVLVGAWHGITMAGLENLTIANNTVVSTSANKIRITLSWSKTGVAPINNVVVNNLAPTFVRLSAATQATNNYVVANPAADYVSFNLLSGAIDLHLKSTSALYGKGAGAY